MQVSKLGYGCMGLTGVYNDPLSEEDGIEIIKEAFNKGITHFDTSDIYGEYFANEYLVGKVRTWNTLFVYILGFWRKIFWRKMHWET